MIHHTAFHNFSLFDFINKFEIFILFILKGGYKVYNYFTLV